MKNIINEALYAISSIPNTYIKIGFVALFLSILGFFWYLAKYIKEHHYITKLIAKIKHDYHLQNSIRQEELEQQIKNKELNTDSFLLKIELLLQRSNIKKHFPDLSAGLFILLLLMFSALTFFISTFLTGSTTVGLLAGIVFVISIFSILHMIINRKNLKVEDELELFLNLLENFSAGTDSLYNILLKTSNKVSEPLNIYLKECCNEISINGDVSIALNNLKYKVDHPQFEKIITYLELASDYEANYSKIINLNNRELTIFLDNQKKKRSINKNTRIELLIIGCAGALILWMSMSYGLILNVFNNKIGQLLGAYSLSVLIIGMVSTFKK